MNKPCATPACPNTVPVRAGRCVECRGRSEQRRGRPTAARRGYDSAWRTLRAAMLKRSPICQVPGCPAPAVEVDHLTPIRAGGARLRADNLRTSCARHHREVTAKYDGSFGRPTRDGKAEHYGETA